jgi:tRNA pseudouridine32 synthase / 23S rRNA pseudouridine746 synthase
MCETLDPVCDKPSWIVLPGEGDFANVYEFFCQHFPHISSSEWRRRFAAGFVRNTAGQTITADRAFSSLAHQKLSYFRVVQAEQEIPFREDIVFEDELILVADKPHFLPVQPAGRYLEQTLLTRLQRRLNLPQLTPAHRIDQGTAGLVLLVKQPAFRDTYQRLFREHKIAKTYHAIAPFRPELHFPMVHTLYANG